MSSKMEKLKSTMMLLFVIEKREKNKKINTKGFESIHCFPFQPLRLKTEAEYAFETFLFNFFSF